MILFRLSLVFTIAGLLASRLGLLVHEFFGHGGMAYALGGTLPNWRLFLFGGGWIQYQRDPWYTTEQEVAIALAGLGAEIVVAALLWSIASRGRALGQSIGKIAAMLLIAHASVYLATGLHYGFGDGSLLHSLLSPGWRWLICLSLSVVMTVMAYLLTRQGILVAAKLEVAGGPKRVAWVVLAIVCAGGVHTGLLLAERALAGPDKLYELTMQQEVDKAAAQHAANLAAQQELVGQPWSPAQVAQVRYAFAEKHKPWPLRLLLVVLAGVAAAAACFRCSRIESNKLVPWRLSTLRIPTLTLVIALLLIFGINGFG